MANEEIFNDYLKKYRDKYKVFKQQDNVWEIACKKGDSICIYDLGSKTLLFSFFSGKSARSANLLKKKLQQKKVWHQINQEGDVELTIIFKESDLHLVEDLFKIKKKRNISPEYREILVKRMKKARMELK